MSEKNVSIALRLKDGISKSLKSAQNGVKKFGAAFADTFKKGPTLAVAMGSAISQFARQAIASMKKWITETKAQFLEFENSNCPPASSIFY